MLLAQRFEVCLDCCNFLVCRRYFVCRYFSRERIERVNHGLLLCSLAFFLQPLGPFGFAFGRGTTAGYGIHQELHNGTGTYPVCSLFSNAFNQFLAGLVYASGNQVLRNGGRGFLRAFKTTGNQRPFDPLQNPAFEFVRHLTEDALNRKHLGQTRNNAGSSSSLNLFRGSTRSNSAFTGFASTHSAGNRGSGCKLGNPLCALRRAKTFGCQSCSAAGHQQGTHRTKGFSQFDRDGFFVASGYGRFEPFSQTLDTLPGSLFKPGSRISRQQRCSAQRRAFKTANKATGYGFQRFTGVTAHGGFGSRDCGVWILR